MIVVPPPSFLFMAFICACCMRCCCCLCLQQQQIITRMMMAPMMDPTTAPAMVPEDGPVSQQYQHCPQQQLELEQYSGQYPQQLQQLQQQLRSQQLQDILINDYKKMQILSAFLFPFYHISISNIFNPILFLVEKFHYIYHSFHTFFHFFNTKMVIQRAPQLRMQLTNFQLLQTSSRSIFTSYQLMWLYKRTHISIFILFIISQVDMGNCWNTGGAHEPEKQSLTRQPREEVVRTDHGQAHRVTQFQPQTVTSSPANANQSPTKLRPNPVVQGKSVVATGYNNGRIVQSPPQVLQGRSYPPQQSPRDSRMPIPLNGSGSDKLARTSVSTNRSFQGDHISGYKHVHLVRAPSFLQNSGQLRQLRDSSQLGNFFQPSLNLRKTNSISGNGLERIREEPASQTHY